MTPDDVVQVLLVASKLDGQEYIYDHPDAGIRYFIKEGAVRFRRLATDCSQGVFAKTWGIYFVVHQVGIGPIEITHSSRSGGLQADGTAQHLVADEDGRQDRDGRLR